MVRYFILSLLLLGLLLDNGSLANIVPETSILVPESSVIDGVADIYLPIVMRPRPQSIFGAETYDFSDQNLNYADAANIYWIRSYFFSWAQLEPQRGVYQWDLVKTNALNKLAHNSHKVIATIKFTPSWAQKLPGVSCGPIADHAWVDFYNFVYNLVLRYSAPPYNIQYWEFGNEPDVDPSLVAPDEQYGCWGNKNDPYYGGRYYAEMLKRAYPAVKAASPTSQVVIGGLLLDCDPTNPPPHKDCSPGKFFEGILRNQGANYFDIVAFHSYLYEVDNKILDEDNPSWSARGGQIVGKANFLRSVMQRFGVNKPLFLSELAMKWHCDGGPTCPPPTGQFLDLQADVVVSSYARSWGLGILGETWFTLEESGWASSGLFQGSTPKPAYHALVFMSSELNGAALGPQLTQFAGLRGYEFRLPSKNVWILWAPDGATGVLVQIPAGVTKIFDKFGNEITPIPGQLTISHPVYLEFSH